MLDALTITEAEAAGLSELAALDMVMARDFAARAQAAEDPETANDLARSYQRMARSYRQSLALKVRLAREIARAEREPPAPILRDEARIEARIEEIRGPVQRVIWAEHEPADPSELGGENDLPPTTSTSWNNAWTTTPATTASAWSRWTSTWSRSAAPWRSTPRSPAAGANFPTRRTRRSKSRTTSRISPRSNGAAQDEPPPAPVR